MRVLYLGLGDDYGDRSRGPSFEAANFQDTLERMPALETRHWDFARELAARGYLEANRALLQVVREWEPAVLFCVLFEEQLDPDVVAYISHRTTTVTVNWFCDDHWRWPIFSRYWAPKFNWVVTTWEPAVRLYRDNGQPNVILSQWACNHFSYRPTPGPRSYEVTFVGQPHTDRRRRIKRIGKSGIEVMTWGLGWPGGRIAQEEMLQVFTSSKVNLNFATGLRLAARGRGRPTRQVKGRVFEVPACGGLLMTEYAEGLEAFFELDDEIVTFQSDRELIEKLTYLLEHEAERRAIATRGRARVLRDHTYEQRLNEIFETIGAVTNRT